MNKKPSKAVVSNLYRWANEEALKVVEYEVRKVMRQHPTMREFVMGMGTWFFVDRYGLYHSGTDLPRAYIRPLSDFIDQWDNYLKLTGIPMRFTATGEVRHDW